VLITDLHVAHVPEGGYAAYDSGKAAGIFLKMPDGSDYVGKVWPGDSVFPDFSRPAARDWWGEQYKAFTAMGVHGFWNDMNEPAIFEMRSKTMPPEVVHRIEEPGFAPRNASHAEMHNVYGMLNSRATYDGLRALRPGLRPFVLTRASFAGGQRYAATWTGDNVSSWEHLRLSTAMLLNLGLSGFGLAGDDIGGFAGAGPSAELLTRWIEVGAFNPLFRDHAGKGKPAQEPYAGPADQVAIRRRYIEARYRLLPYLYALAEQQSRTGVPMMRPVFLEFPEVLRHGERLGGTSEEFLLGPALLVAPAPEGESPHPYRVTLPGPGWYDYWSAARLPASVVDERPQLERLPVYVRPGTILPRQPLVQSSRQRPDGPLELMVYPGPDCAGEIYLDDGESDRHVAGAYLRQHMTCRTDGAATVVEIGAREGGFPPWWTGIDVVVAGLAAPPQRTLVDGAVAPGEYDPASGAVRIRLPDVPRGAAVRVDGGAAP
jgi:alpha-glucosidase